MPTNRQTRFFEKVAEAARSAPIIKPRGRPVPENLTEEGRNQGLEAMWSAPRCRSKRRDGQTSDLQAEISAAADAGREWRRQSEHLLRGLSEPVTEQFTDWGLTHPEADIAAMILKGAALREIAQAPRTSKATIRQQAQSIYQKSSLANRSQLAAYFSDDLFDVAAGRNALLQIPTSAHLPVASEPAISL